MSANVRAPSEMVVDYSNRWLGVVTFLFGYKPFFFFFIRGIGIGGSVWCGAVRCYDCALSGFTWR